MRALWKLGRNCYLCVWCVSGWPLRVLSEADGRYQLLTSACRVSPLFFSPHILSCVLDYCPSNLAPKAAAHLSCHTGSEGRAFPQDGLFWVQAFPE